MAGVIGAERLKFSSAVCTEACLYNSKRICTNQHSSYGADSTSIEIDFTLPSAGGSFCVGLFELGSPQEQDFDGWINISPLRMIDSSSPFCVQTPLKLNLDSSGGKIILPITLLHCILIGAYSKYFSVGSQQG